MGWRRKNVAGEQGGSRSWITGSRRYLKRYRARLVRRISKWFARNEPENVPKKWGYRGWWD